jgi:hypothetical protein
MEPPNYGLFITPKQAAAIAAVGVFSHYLLSFHRTWQRAAKRNTKNTFTSSQ